MIGLCLLAGVLVAGLLFPAAVGLGALSKQASATINNLSSDLATIPPPLVTRVLDKDGNLIATLYDQYRLPVASNQISNTMKAAIVAVEDKRFYDHGGVDWKGTLRAAIHDAGGGSTQGASTITQQYVKNYLVNVVDRNNPLEQKKDQAQTIARKLREARIAQQLEQNMSKDQILTGYLNVVAFGARVYGIGAAAQGYFGTTPDKLTVPQAALLAGLVNNPIVLNPWVHPKKALDRRNLVIDRMVENKSLDPAGAAAAKKAPLGILPDLNQPSSSCIGAPDYAGFFCDYAKQYLEESGFTEEQIDTGGYTIKTTLDPNVSKAAKAAVDQNVAPNADGVANAFAVIQPGKSHHNVLAMVANRNLGNNPPTETSTNIVSNVSNQFGGGSTFKIFTSAAALEQGKAGLDTPLPDPAAQCFMPPIHNRFDHCTPLHNINGNYPDPITLRDALRTSPNIAFLNLEQQVGMPSVLDMAYRLGLRKTMRTNQHGSDPKNYQDSKDTRYNEPQSKSYLNRLSFTLGFSPVSPLEMTNVAATIKSGGVWCPPNPIESVTDRNGKPLPVHALPCQQAISPSVAGALMQGMSQDTVSGTSAAAARAAHWTRPDIGKTGTTQQNESVAFVGGVGDYAVSSMVFADGKNPTSICPGHPVTHISDSCGHAFGGNTASPPYFQAFDQILAGQSTPPIPPADPAFLQANPHGPVVPFVVGDQSNAAQSSLKKAGYNVALKDYPNNSPKGIVVAETPQGNIGGGSTITLYVSTGKG